MSNCHGGVPRVRIDPNQPFVVVEIDPPIIYRNIACFYGALNPATGRIWRNSLRKNKDAAERQCEELNLWYHTNERPPDPW